MLRLKDAGIENPSLERLRAHLSVEERQEELEVEIRREMASALGRASVKVDMALLELALAEKALEEEASEARVEAYRAARKKAYDARLDLRIHREAIGIRHNTGLDRDYPIPPVHPAAAR